MSSGPRQHNIAVSAANIAFNLQNPADRVLSRGVLSNRADTSTLWPWAPILHRSDEAVGRSPSSEAFFTILAHFEREGSLPGLDPTGFPPINDERHQVSAHAMQV